MSEPEIDTSRHRLTQSTITLELELENMPSLATHYGRARLIAQKAEVTFRVESGVITWRRIELSGSVPTKEGYPSRRANTDDWHPHSFGPRAGQPHDDMPVKYFEIVTSATEILREMLK